MLRCSDGTLYTGAASDPDRRLAEHRSGRGAKYIRGRLPVERMLLEEHPDRSAALRREAEIKRMPRARKLLLAGTSGGDGGTSRRR